MESCYTTPREHALMDSMVNQDIWRLSVPKNNKVVWNPMACWDFLRKAGEIVNLMITLVHLGARPPLRGEELVLDQIENGCQLRTLYLVFGQMLAIRCRSKDTWARGIDVFNACYFPRKLTEAICYYVIARNLLNSFAVSVLQVRHELYNLLNSMCESEQVMAAAGMSKPITN